MDLEPIVQAECEDCGTTIVIDPSFFSIVVLNGEFTGVTLCQYCERPLISEMTPELAEDLEKKDVKVLYWQGIF